MTGLTLFESGALSQLDRIVYYFKYAGMSAAHSIREIDEDVLGQAEPEVGCLALGEVVGIVAAWRRRSATADILDSDDAADAAAMDAIEKVLREAGHLHRCFREEAAPGDPMDPRRSMWLWTPGDGRGR